MIYYQIKYSRQFVNYFYKILLRLKYLFLVNQR